jgi:hypothetical protein
MRRGFAKIAARQRAREIATFVAIHTSCVATKQSKEYDRSYRFGNGLENLGQQPQR